jgi:hypothetical protein
MYRSVFCCFIQTVKLKVYLTLTAVLWGGECLFTGRLKPAICLQVRSVRSVYMLTDWCSTMSVSYNLVSRIRLYECSALIRTYNHTIFYNQTNNIFFIFVFFHPCLNWSYLIHKNKFRDGKFLKNKIISTTNNSSRTSIYNTFQFCTVWGHFCK